MKIYNMEPKYVKEALELALEEYSNECTKCPSINEGNFEKELEVPYSKDYLKNKYGKVAAENGKVIGYLAFQEPRDGLHGKCKRVFSAIRRKCIYR